MPKKPTIPFLFLFIFSLVFFLLINFGYLLGIDTYFLLTLVFFVFMACCFLALGFLLYLQISNAGKEKFSNRIRMLLIIWISFVLITTIMYPQGMFRRSVEHNSLLIANREGAANCMSTLYLEPDSTFNFSVFCFGNSSSTGHYNIQHDTIFFHLDPTSDPELMPYSHATLQPNNEDQPYLTLFIDQQDTIGIQFYISKDILTVHGDDP